jgi:hypothetical protein
MNQIFFVSALSLGLLHCGGSEAAVAPDAAPDCSQDVRAQPFAPGMAATASDGVQVILVSALPAPPQRFDNRWSLQVKGADDLVLEGASLGVTPFMPDHGHGSPSPPTVEPGEQLGSFEMGPFDLWMPGIWELNFAVEIEATTSLAKLTICVQE